MASTYSSNLRLELIASGQQANTWGNTTNTNLGTLLEQAITGITDVDISSGDVTLTALNGAYDQSRGAILSVTGASGSTRTIFTQANVSKVYIVDNASTVNVIVKTLASGTPVGVTIPAGTAKLIYTDGTDYYEGSNAADLFTATAIEAGAITMSGPIAMGTNKITGLGTPTVSTDAVTKAYVDAIAPGQTSGSSILSGNGSGGFSNVTVGSGLAFAGGTLSSTASSPIPSGTVMLFAQANPPVGWTSVSGLNDKALRVVNSGGTGGITGGSVAFSTAFTSKSVTGSISGTTDGHAISEAQMPSHTHSVGGGNYLVTTGSGYSYVGTNAAFSLWTAGISNTGGGQAHSHNLSGSAVFTGTAINLAVQYLDIIVATKA